MNRKILVVDDELDILDLVRITLKSGRYDVVTATSGEEALQLISQEKPNLVLLDVVLPGLSGLELCRRLKRDPTTYSPIKVVLFTALGTEVDTMLEKRDKADGYLAKPFSSKTLLGLMERLLVDPHRGAKP
jgi:DNA-binding response OmpR family regulator